MKQHLSTTALTVAIAIGLVAGSATLEAASIAHTSPRPIRTRLPMPMQGPMTSGP